MLTMLTSDFDWPFSFHSYHESKDGKQVTHSYEILLSFEFKIMNSINFNIKIASSKIQDFRSLTRVISFNSLLRRNMWALFCLFAKNDDNNIDDGCVNSVNDNNDDDDDDDDDDNNNNNNNNNNSDKKISRGRF